MVYIYNTLCARIGELYRHHVPPQLAPQNKTHNRARARGCVRSLFLKIARARSQSFPSRDLPLYYVHSRDSLLTLTSRDRTHTHKTGMCVSESWSECVWSGVCLSLVAYLMP